jgi:hypothetical protein
MKPWQLKEVSSFLYDSKQAFRGVAGFLIRKGTAETTTYRRWTLSWSKAENNMMHSASLDAGEDSLMKSASFLT